MPPLEDTSYEDISHMACEYICIVKIRHEVIINVKIRIFFYDVIIHRPSNLMRCKLQKR
jgi:hypothetical protein